MNEKPLQPLDIMAAPLTGLSLIEASAGTGKTYTIAGLYVRLILQAERQVNRILVVTYTKAATEELRSRIRERLVSARAAFQGEPSEDGLLQSLLQALPDRDKAVRRLTNAIRGFDEAAIFTIHGFCQRVLMDSAFESNMPFETELLTDQRELLQEIVDDFWRRTFYRSSPLLADYLVESGLSPETLLDEIKSYLAKPYLKVLAPEPSVGPEKAEKAFATAYTELRKRWWNEREAVAAILTESTALNGNKYRKGSLPGWLKAMDEYLTPETPNLRLFERFVKFTAGELAMSTKKGHSTPEHPVFDAADTVLAAQHQLGEYYQMYLRSLRAELLEYANRELELRKRRLSTQSYDDLLNHLLVGLQGSQGESLAQTVRQRFSTALIDEFQDTDPVQYEIFRRIYLGSEGPVFLVGDPKQAIYSFRGADIFAYLQARNDAPEGQQFTLAVNWRSEPRLIHALNLLFEQSPQPFLFPEIGFQPVAAAERERERLLIEGAEEPPFIFWFAGREEDERLLGKGETAAMAASACAVEIARLLNLAASGEALIGEQPLDGGDIAVLVRSHRQGRLVRDELLKLGVPSVQQAQDNVFTSWEAQELERVLLAVAEPNRDHLVKAALISDMFGLHAEDVLALSEDEAEWEARLEAFHAYHRLWEEHGFIRMLRTLLSEENIPQRLLKYIDGERRLTNLLHLEELLQATASRRGIGMEGLIKWLAERRLSQTAEDEEYQLRLESDEQLVKIVTMHKSKGLEYPIVFCPFLWDGTLRAERSELFSFHDPADRRRVTLELGSERQDELRPLARAEELAENLRLLYVALTRAKYRLYLLWGGIKEAATSAPGWLLHQPPIKQTDIDNVAEYISSLADEKMLADLRGLAEAADGAVRIETPPEPDEGDQYRPPEQEESQYEERYFAGPVTAAWNIHSFTSLTMGYSAEQPDYDLRLRNQEPLVVGDARSIFDFPRGARAGLCLHAILESLDFVDSDAERLTETVNRGLEQHGFEPDWAPVLVDCIRRLLQTPLPDGIRLGAIGRRRRLDEMEFYYPLAGLRAQTLIALLAEHYPQGDAIRERLDNLQFDMASGFMKGYIDLVFEAGGRFYLIDYKSNWLGERVEDYAREAVTQTMAREAYYFQYMIYLVALHRYLQARMPGYDYERHFGGVGYLFLRGIDPDIPDNGIFWDRPPLSLVTALDALLAGSSTD